MLLQLRYPILLFLGSFIFLMIGMLCKICHWPGVQLITGVMLLMQVMAVVKLLSAFLNAWFALAFIVGVMAMIAGLMFKIMHWPNAQPVFGTAAIVNILMVGRLTFALLKKREQLA